MNMIPRAKLDRLKEALLARMSVREAARFAGVSKQTANTYFRALRDPRFMCGCGRPSVHRGFCGYRRGKEDIAAESLTLPPRL